MIETNVGGEVYATETYKAIAWGGDFELDEADRAPRARARRSVDTRRLSVGTGVQDPASRYWERAATLHAKCGRACLLHGAGMGHGDRVQGLKSA